MFFADDSKLGGWIGNYYIVISPEATEPVQYAAHQLQEYLRKIRKKVLRIVSSDLEVEPHHRYPLDKCIYVGPSQLLRKRYPEVAKIKLTEEELFIWKQKETLVLTGGSSRAVLYAVYYFLEKYLGVRFFTSDEEFLPPQIPDLPEKINDRDKPAFEYRDMVYLWRASGDWAAKNRINGHFANVNRLQGGRRAFYTICHTFERMIPPSEFKSHPEYFSEISGERIPRQLCLSNKKVQEICTQTVLRWIEENPMFDIFSLSENDGGGFCECERCRKMNAGEQSQAAIIMKFVNLVARKVGKKYPDKLIETLSYAQNRFPPKGIKVEPNVLIRLCGDKEIRKRLDSWLKVTPNIYIWSYTVFNYYPMLDVLEKSAKYFHKKGVKGIFFETGAQTGRGGIETMDLRLYIASRVLWNPNEKIRPHVEEYMRHYYGPAANEMLECLDRSYALKKKMKMDWRIDYGWYDGNYQMHPYLTELAQQCQAAFKSARTKCRNTKYEQRIEEAAVPFMHNELFGGEMPVRFTRKQAFPRDIHGREEKAAKFFDISKKSNIAWDDLERSIQPVPLHRLKCGELEVLVLPTVGGRIVQVYFGKQAVPLVVIPPNQMSFETVGFEEYIGSFFKDPGWKETFHILNSSPSEIKLKTKLDNGLEVKRHYRVDTKNNLVIETSVKNITLKPKEGKVRFHPRWRYDHKSDKVFYSTVKGKRREVLIAKFSEMLNREHMFVSDAGRSGRYLDGDELPESKWTFDLRSVGVRIEHGFDSKSVEKTLMIGSDKGYFTEDVISKGHRLMPGKSMTFRHYFQFKLLSGNEK